MMIDDEGGADFVLKMAAAAGQAPLLSARIAKELVSDETIVL